MSISILSISHGLTTPLFPDRCIYFLDPNAIIPHSAISSPALLLPCLHANSGSQPNVEPIILEPLVISSMLSCCHLPNFPSCLSTLLPLLSIYPFTAWPPVPTQALPCVLLHFSMPLYLSHLCQLQFLYSVLTSDKWH